MTAHPRWLEAQSSLCHGLTILRVLQFCVFVLLLRTKMQVPQKLQKSFRLAKIGVVGMWSIGCGGCCARRPPWRRRIQSR
ncbi:hypothetical protein L596_023133 [Steinernema carpocapsae]|uniref:Uncharacterized protein n=1 Tax=Steinernema carpocapsae TaxID=34508 RepID=A0A4U5MCR1_STECR|nr:hypothetical protein L596_023133 [Steinernema carpocapsae]